MRGIEALLLLGLMGLVWIGARGAKHWLYMRDTVAANSAPSPASTTAIPLGGKTERKKIRSRNLGGHDEGDRAVAFKDLPAFCGGGEGASAALCCETACGRAPDEADSSVLKPVTKTEAPLSTTEAPSSTEAPLLTKAPLAPPFPTRDDLPVGATGVQIRAQFGEPAARITETKDGLVFERYYYYNRDHTKLTVARLRGGVIVSAENTLP
jgi:hypothetical protein